MQSCRLLLFLLLSLSAVYANAADGVPTNTLTMASNMQTADSTLSSVVKLTPAQLRHERRAWKTEKTLAWTSLGLGVAALLVGEFALGIEKLNERGDSGGKSRVASTIFRSSGAAFMGGSIPLFIYSHKHRKRYLRLKANPQLISSQSWGSSSTSPAVTFAFTW